MLDVVMNIFRMRSVMEENVRRFILQHHSAAVGAETNFEFGFCSTTLYGSDSLHSPPYLLTDMAKCVEEVMPLYPVYSDHWKQLLMSLL